MFKCKNLHISGESCAMVISFANKSSPGIYGVVICHSFVSFEESTFVHRHFCGKLNIG